MDIKLFDVVNLYIAAGSIILAILAIWLSITFYRWSEKASREAEKAARNIEASVDKLESLFKLMYSDMSSIVKVASAEHTSMLRESLQTWQKKYLESPDKFGTERIIEEKATPRVQELTKSLVSEALERNSGTGMAEVRDKLNSAVTKAIEGGRRIEIETRQEVLRKSIKDLLSKQPTAMLVHEALSQLGDAFPRSRIIQELQRLADEGEIQIAPQPMTPNSRLMITTH